MAARTTSNNVVRVGVEMIEAGTRSRAGLVRQLEFIGELLVAVDGGHIDIGPAGIEIDRREALVFADRR